MLSACTAVTVHGETAVSRSFLLGPARIAATAGEDMVVVRSRGLGIAPRRGGFFVGAHSETSISVLDPAACRLVVLMDRSAAKDAVDRVLQLEKEGGGDICAVQEEP
jgi:hypothetical protein